MLPAAGCQVDILVNNAGLALSLSSVSDHDIEVGTAASAQTPEPADGGALATILDSTVVMLGLQH